MKYPKAEKVQLKDKKTQHSKLNRAKPKLKAKSSQMFTKNQDTEH